ncbi:hypothetical protein KY289_009822 [Solanum tuberosum]|nr:hypothetical protein KY289_009822 [Solanum tuberosum]
MNKKENGTIGFWTRPRLRVLWTLRPPATSGSKLAPYVGKLGEECISIAKDSIQPQVPLRLPCYDFTPVEDPTVVCANKTTKGLCGTSVPQKSWVIIGPMLRAKPIPRRTIRTEAIFPDSLRLTALLPIVIAIVAPQLGAGTQLVALARHSAPRLTSVAKTFSLGACLSNTKRGPPSIPLSFGLATVLPRRSVSRVSWAPDPRRPRANTHRLRHGLPGYLILFAPHAFAPQRRFWRLSLSTRFTAYVPFTPSHSEEHLPPPSYRGCWHGVSRGFFLESCHDRALDERALQAALPFFTHAILLDRAFAHCPRFPTAAPRGSPGRVSVPVWLIIRKDQLSIIGLLGASFPSAQLPENNVRLACVKHIASVPSEPGSNSSFEYDWALQWFFTGDPVDSAPTILKDKIRSLALPTSPTSVASLVAGVLFVLAIGSKRDSDSQFGFLFWNESVLKKDLPILKRGWFTPGDESSSTPQPLRSRRAMSLLAVAQPSIEATSADCDSTRPWIKALTRSRRRCATGLTLFLPAWGVAMDAKMKTPQRQLGVECLAAPLTMREGDTEENNSRALATPSTQFRCPTLTDISSIFVDGRSGESIQLDAAYLDAVLVPRSEGKDQDIGDSESDRTFLSSDEPGIPLLSPNLPAQGKISIGLGRGASSTTGPGEEIGVGKSLQQNQLNRQRSPALLLPSLPGGILSSMAKISYNKKGLTFQSDLSRFRNGKAWLKAKFGVIRHFLRKERQGRKSCLLISPSKGVLSLIATFLGHFAVRVMPIRITGILCSQLLSGILIFSVGGSLPLPGPSGQASGAEFEEDHFGIDVLLESWEKSTETGTSVDQPEPEPGHVPPAIQVAPRGNEAGPSNQPPRVVPYPYQLDEVIGGDSVQSIQQRLLAKYSYTPPIGIMYLAEIEAKDLFEVKVEIIRIMAVLDPTGDWLGRGARALENPRTATGEHSLDKLHTLLSDLESRGVNSESFSQLKGKRKANCLLAGSCMSGNVHVRLREKGGGQKWPCCTSLSSSMGSALSFLGEYANMILMRCGALHLTFVGLLSSGACAPAFLCNKPLRPKTSGRWSCGAFGKG